MAVLLRTLGAQFSLDPNARTAEVAQFWTKTLRNRSAWSGLAGLRQDFALLTRTHLQDLFPELSDGARFAHLASAGLVEVQFSGNDIVAGASWDVPWEFLLSAATEKTRARNQPLLVFRHLVTETQGTSPFTQPHNCLVITNNPGFLGDLYTDNTFLREEKNVRTHLDLDTLTTLHNDHLESMRRSIAAQSPAVIHVAGVDAEQAAKVNPALSVGVKEALMVEAPQGGAYAAATAELAPVICGGEVKPTLVSLNFVNSGSEMAPSIVCAGAGAAIGFFNDFDDIVAETFFASFYLGWRLSRWSLLDAFRLAWSQIPSSGWERLWGTGLALWCRESLLDHDRVLRSAAEKRFNPARPAEGLRRDFDRARENPISEEEEKNITVGVTPHNEINYSLLHNNRSLFRYFFIRKPQCVGRLSNLSVEVILHAGEPLSYRTKGELSNTVWMLQDEVRVPLTSTLARSVRETVYTALMVHVGLRGKTILEKTFRVSLLPIDQWQDDDMNRKWLPSFVLPRDPSIAQVVDSAQQYLVAMSDDSDAAFDGYASGPQAVKIRVAAIWWSLVNGLRISYSSPPPTYNPDAQRLRSPSALLKSHRGTCIELALLLAACLESIDLYPVIFLLDRHALVGYYRDEPAHKKVCDWIIRNAGPDSDPWVLDGAFHPKLLELVRSGEIVPVESTALTRRRGFQLAVDEGIRRIGDNFEYLFDVKLARESGVTPLPLLDFE